jgi:hypothetical protein
MPTNAADHVGTDRHEPAAEHRRHLRWALPLTGVGAALLTAAGLSGVGDAPHPTQPDASIAEHFRRVDGAVLTAAPFGQVGAIAVAAFVLGLARRLQRSGHHPGVTTSAAALAVGGAVAAAYLLLLHVTYATLAYEVAASSPETTKALFTATILAVPVFGLGVAIALAGAACGAVATKLLPMWWTALTGAGAALAAVAVVSYQDTGYLSPDVQQQVVGNVLLVWLLVTAVTVGVRRHGTSA